MQQVTSSDILTLLGPFLIKHCWGFSLEEEVRREMNEEGQARGSWLWSMSLLPAAEHFVSDE